MLSALQLDHPAIRAMMERQELFYQNPRCRGMEAARPLLPVNLADIRDAEARLRRFGPLMARLFPETAAQSGILESPLTELPRMAQWLRQQGGQFAGRLLLKRDDLLPVAGSVKARGGIYEVLKHAEDLARMAGILQKMDSYGILAEHRDFFQQYRIEVGSTGNLGLSVGLMGAALGFQTVVHMSADAKAWKKDLLRMGGATVIEYKGNYSDAVEKGRIQSQQNPKSYFVDDEHSVNLFLGYAVAASRLRRQLAEWEIPVDQEHPLLVCIPCGVGGAPGGITFGLREVFGDHVHCFFAEPTESPCMTLGMASGLHGNVCVQDIGLSGITLADGLAVGRPSGFAGKIMEPLLDGCFTLSEDRFLRYMQALWATEEIFVEPSAAAGFVMAQRLGEVAPSYQDMLEQGTLLVWATGGSLVPESVRRQMLNQTETSIEGFGETENGGASNGV